MRAYVIVEMEVTDPVKIEQYRALAGASVTAHGGRFVVRGGTAEALEGGWQPKRIVVLEFPDMTRARSWWQSQDYAAARVIRNQAASTRMILVEGVG